MTSDFKKSTPLSEDNVEENMEDILNSIRQIMNMDIDQASTKSAKTPGSPAREISDILNIAPTSSQSQPAAALKPKAIQDDVLVLKRQTTPAKEKAVPHPKEKAKDSPQPQKLNAPLSLPSMVENAIKPVIEQWLNDNLERILEDIVREEIKKMLNITRQERTL